MRYVFLLFILSIAHNLDGQGKVEIMNRIESTKTLIDSDPDEAMYQASELFVVSRDIEFDLGMLESYLIVGRSYILIAEFDKAIASLNIALDYAKKMQSPAYISDCYFYIGQAHDITDNMDLQLQFLNKAHELRRGIKDQARLADSYHAFGNLYFSMEKDSLAEVCYLIALEIRKINGDAKGLAAIYNNLGLIENNQGNIDRYRELLWKSLRLNERTSSNRSLATNHGNLGVSFLEEGILDSAWYHSSISFHIREERGFRDHLAGSYADLGDIKVAQGATEEAIEYYVSGAAIAELIGGIEGAIKNYNSLARIYSEIGDEQQSRHYQSLSDHLSDSLEFGKIPEEAIPAIPETEQRRGQNEAPSSFKWIWIIIPSALLLIGLVLYVRRHSLDD